MEKFKIWSETNPEALSKLSPDLGINNWSYLKKSDKEKMFRHFQFKGFFANIYQSEVFNTILKINDDYKYNTFGDKLIKHLDYRYHGEKIGSCCYEVATDDFHYIFLNHEEDVVYQLITIYANNLIFYDHFNDFETLDEKRKQHRIKSAYQNFDTFAEVFNDIFNSFGLNVVLTRSGLIPKQEVKITEEIYKPVIAVLSDPKWDAVNRDLKDAFVDYRLNTVQGFSASITHTVSALQAFLQLIVYDKTGKGDLSDLIKDATKKGLIPNDPFSKKIFENILSILMQERQSKSDSHPKEEYATEKHARLMLNLTMVFIQHCIQGN